MHELKEKLDKLCALKEKLICDVKPHVEKGVFYPGVNGDGVGQAIDMIKDLCEAEEKLCKAKYYHYVCEAMAEAKEDNEAWKNMMCGIAMAGMMNAGMDGSEDKMGYDNWRYSSGRFAPTGKGHYAGYTEPIQHKGGRPDMRDMMDKYDTGNAGYPHRSTNMSHRVGRYGYPMDEKYGESYNMYEDAKKHYHESNDPAAKKEMSDHAKMHLEDVVDTTTEIWNDADPKVKKEFKEHMMKLLKDVPMN